MEHTLEMKELDLGLVFTSVGVGGGVYCKTAGTAIGSDMLVCEFRNDSNSILEYFSLCAEENKGRVFYFSAMLTYRIGHTQQLY